MQAFLFSKKNQSIIGNDLNDRCYATCFVDQKVGVSKFERHREFSRIIHSKGSSLLIISYTTLLTLTNEKTSTKHHFQIKGRCPKPNQNSNLYLFFHCFNEFTKEFTHHHFHIIYGQPYYPLRVACKKEMPGR